MGSFQPVEVHIPIHPLARTDRRLGRILWSNPDRGRILLSHQPCTNQGRDFLLDEGGALRILRGHPFAHLLAHEHRVGADVNDSTLLVQALHEGLDLWINQRLPAADRDHRGVAFLRRREAILKRQKIFQRSGIFANPAATGARKITGMQRFELQHGGKFFRPTKLLADNVGGDLRRERERKSHKCGILTSMLRLSMEPAAAI